MHTRASIAQEICSRGIYIGQAFMGATEEEVGRLEVISYGILVMAYWLWHISYGILVMA